MKIGDVRDFTKLENLKNYLLNNLPKKFRAWILQIDNIETISRLTNERLNATPSMDGFCGSISWVVSLALKDYEIDSQIILLTMLVGNEDAINLYRQGGFKAIEDSFGKEGEKTWTIGTGFTNDMDDFHAILFIKNDGSLLDMTASQMQRIEKNVMIDNYWALDKESLPASIIYFRPKDQSFNPKTVAIIRHRNYAQIVAEVKREIKQMLKLDNIEIQTAKITRNKNRLVTRN